MEWSEIIKNYTEFEGVKIEKYTPMYYKTISGGFVGCLKEYPGVATQADNKEELIESLKDALEAMKQAEIYFNETNS